MRILGVVLAGGGARRMGGVDKAFVRLNGTALIEHVLARLAPQVSSIAISANGNLQRFRDIGCDVLPDSVPLGPLSGILSALDWAAAHGAAAVVSAPVDAPFLPADLAARLALAAGSGVAVARCDGRDHPVFGLWPVALAEDLRRFLASGEKPKVTTFADRHQAIRADFPDAGAFLNLNSPEDLAHAEALIRGAA
ncbi:molybdenum cofactor guanylyltransferase MobA [Tabrizicola sp.]|uniref:molybdenum cofactor guanylyltransferase MobA n=1 Tax=Tabrizicola sp. TaxID=2005166 RepID=UPI00286D63CE|nr:molybdenum cofactor guanylyltransferase MobA [Tabrizicola sp.]